VPRTRPGESQEREIGGGSGFLVSADGLVVTNKHVVTDQAATYTALTKNGEEYPATLVAVDPFLDIAILRLRGNNFPYLELGNSEALQLGQTVIAIGNALGEFRNSVSVGVISGLGRSITAGDRAGRTEQLEQVIQTDAAINPGNSGGPLINLAGEAIGVNVAVALGSENIGFAIPINAVEGAVASVKATGAIVRPYLGIRYVAITPELATRNNLSVDYGVLVARGASPEELAVIPGSPANQAGIVENDIILEFNGQRLTGNNTLSSLIRQTRVGQTVRLKILHRGTQKTVEVKLEKVPSGDFN
jgi:serine protease Do